MLNEKTQPHTDGVLSEIRSEAWPVKASRSLSFPLLLESKDWVRWKDRTVEPGRRGSDFPTFIAVGPW